MEIGIVGKPNVGKSTFFNALTLLDAVMAPYPFTTVKPNRGVTAVRYPCPHVEKGRPCDPGNAACRNGTRWVPVSVVDVAGLVPGAHEGRGLGNQFLNDLSVADGFIQVVDGSGGTDSEGAPVGAGTVDPADEVRWLGEELGHWIADILGREFDRHARRVELEGEKLESVLEQRVTGLKVPPAAVLSALRDAAVDRLRPSKWSEEDRLRLARALLEAAKPRFVAINKSDKITPSVSEALAERLRPIPALPTSAEAELLLRRASRAGLVEYSPGDPDFRIPDTTRLSPAQARALGEVRAILSRWGATGIQKVLETMVFERLRRFVVFPVEDDTHWTDSRGRTLPDAFLVPNGTTARELAYRVHSDLGERFVRAIDARTHRALGADHPLENGAVVRVVARK